MSIHTYDVPDITCPICVQAITGALDKTPFKQCAREIDIANHKLTLYLNEDEEAFKQLETQAVDDLVFSALQEVGFDEVISKGVIKKTKPYSHAFWGTLGLSSGFLLLLLPLLFTSMPFAVLGTLSLLSTALTLRLGWPFYRRAYLGLWQGAWTMDTLFSMSTAVILGVSLGALFFPALPMMFEAGLLVFGFRHAGIAIADAFKANLLSIRRFQEDVPQYVMRKKGDAFERVALDKLQPGDMITLSPGDILPVDGVFEAGAGMVSSLYQTGSYQSQAIIIDRDAPYPAGTKLVSQSMPLRFRVKATANDSFLAKEDRAVLQSKLNRALEKKKPAANSVAYWLQYFVPIVMGIAALSGITVGLYFGSLMLAIQCAVCVLVAACPCTLGLIAPLVTHIGIKKIEQAGMSVREPDHIEKANNINTILIDLNGTITCGAPKVVRKPNDEALLALMAHLETGQDHWVARAIRQAAKDLPGDIELMGKCTPLESNHNSHQVLFEGKQYVLGDRASMLALGIPPEALEVKIAAIGESVVYLAENRQLKGHVVLEDKVREGAAEVIQALQTTMGKKVYLCTGADAETANRYATAFNIPLNQVFSDCTIEGKNSKQAHLQMLKNKGHQVAMIGDAGNDARAIAAACFGVVVAHEGGHVGTQQGASVVLQTASLLPILQLFKIARSTAINIHQNVWFSFAYNILAMLAPAALLLGAGVVLSPAVGAALMILQTLLVFANVYRFAQAKEQITESKKPVNQSAYADSSLPLPTCHGLSGASIGLENLKKMIPEPMPTCATHEPGTVTSAVTAPPI